MTYIEFVDKTAAENVCACFANPPERVILVGAEPKVLSAICKRYGEIFRDRGIDIEFIPRKIPRYDISRIIEEFSDIVNTYSDCVFDLTGGEDLYLVGIGVIRERFKDKNIQMHRFNIQNNTIKDCDSDGETIIDGEMPEMTIRENIRIYGGDVVYGNDRENATYEWDMNKYFKADIEALWDICRRNTTKWNKQMSTLDAACECCLEDCDEATVRARVSDVTEALSREHQKMSFDIAFFERLKKGGFVKEFSCDEETIYVRFKNEQIKKCLTKAGQVLEMKVFMEAATLRDESGEYFFCDVMNGVQIDWDGEIHESEGSYDTQNEVDVVAMKGMVPVFISCKNGYVDVDELYKLSSVADRFGRQYARKILVVSKLHTARGFEGYLRQRAKDMGIWIIDNVAYMKGKQLGEELCLAWEKTR